ncbi:hypothetical protein KJ632_02965 [Patescibacteria group bacterium]|nr:hypothetical protein [Patescibacteria group bacterium]
MKKGSNILLYLGILAMIVLLAYGAYNYWQKSSLSKASVVLADQYAQLNAEVKKYENDRILEVVNAKQAVAEFRSEYIYWSKIVEILQNTLPKKGKRDLVEILSYSGSSTKDIEVSIQTRPESVNPYFDVADVIESFDLSDNFVDGFVASISSSTDMEGNEVLSFSYSGAFEEADNSAESAPVSR